MLVVGIRAQLEGNAIGFRQFGPSRAFQFDSWNYHFSLAANLGGLRSWNGKRDGRRRHGETVWGTITIKNKFSNYQFSTESE